MKMRTKRGTTRRPERHVGPRPPNPNLPGGGDRPTNSLVAATNTLVAATRSLVPVTNSVVAVAKSVVAVALPPVHALLDAVLPQTCVSCGAWIAGGDRPACDACHAEIAAGLARPYCRRCGRTLPPPAIHERGCARCRREIHWNVAGVARVGVYEPALRVPLVGLKYHGRERNADYLADWMALALRQRGWLDAMDALVPVPMHWLRRRQRPCDHAGVLASALSARIGVPVVRLVRRAKHMPSQTAITAKTARFENVRGCFSLPRWYQPPWPRRDLHGRAVCIVDNVMMTGATVYEVAKVLRKAGAKRIYAVVVARPASPGDPPAVLPPVTDLAT